MADFQRHVRCGPADAVQRGSLGELLAVLWQSVCSCGLGVSPVRYSALSYEYSQCQAEYRYQ